MAVNEPYQSPHAQRRDLADLRSWVCDKTNFRHDLAALAALGVELPVLADHAVKTIKGLTTAKIDPDLGCVLPDTPMDAYLRGWLNRRISSAVRVAEGVYAHDDDIMADPTRPSTRMVALNSWQNFVRYGDCRIGATEGDDEVTLGGDVHKGPCAITRAVREMMAREAAKAEAAKAKKPTEPAVTAAPVAAAPVVAAVTAPAPAPVIMSASASAPALSPGKTPAPSPAPMLMKTGARIFHRGVDVTDWRPGAGYIPLPIKRAATARILTAVQDGTITVDPDRGLVLDAVETHVAVLSAKSRTGHVAVAVGVTVPTSLPAGTAVVALTAVGGLRVGEVRLGKVREQDVLALSACLNAGAYGPCAITDNVRRLIGGGRPRVAKRSTTAASAPAAPVPAATPKAEPLAAVASAAPAPKPPEAAPVEAIAVNATPVEAASAKPAAVEPAPVAVDFPAIGAAADAIAKVFRAVLAGDHRLVADEAEAAIAILGKIKEEALGKVEGRGGAPQAKPATTEEGKPAVKADAEATKAEAGTGQAESQPAEKDEAARAPKMAKRATKVKAETAPPTPHHRTGAATTGKVVDMAAASSTKPVTTEVFRGKNRRILNRTRLPLLGEITTRQPEIHPDIGLVLRDGDEVTVVRNEDRRRYESANRRHPLPRLVPVGLGVLISADMVKSKAETIPVLVHDRGGDAACHRCIGEAHLAWKHSDDRLVVNGVEYTDSRILRAIREAVRKGISRGGNAITEPKPRYVRRGKNVAA